MKNILFPILILLFAAKVTKAQNAHPAFPQAQVNQLCKNIPQQNNFAPLNASQKTSAVTAASIHSPNSNLQLFKETNDFINNKLQHSNWIQNGDTIFVGYTPNDTLRITGYWTHSGPIYVFGTGVLIFDNATVIDSGDIYVFQTGKLFADSSSLTFPQQYFYQRSLQILQNGYAQISNCSFNYSGMSHNLVVAHSGQIYMNNIHQNDWTTCGLYGAPTVSIHGCNITGEYIMTDSCVASFVHADTLLLWHHLPGGASVNYTFTNANPVYGYQFNNLQPGISGINYNLLADSCQNVMWALMPENNTNVTISNSTLRAIGAWFRYGDVATVSGLYDSTMYASTTIPLSDRVLQLNNTYVQTWSLYLFDNSSITLSNSQVGEVGTQQKAGVTQTNPFLLDATGGYYWATDTSAVVSFGALVYSTCRSEKNGMFIMAYDWVPFMAPSAIGNSLLVYVQSESAGDPVAYEAGTVWMDKIDGPDTAFTNTIVPVNGSAWIDWAPLGTGWMDFQNYSVYYQLQGNSTWTNIVRDSVLELHHATVANWNTNGLSAGDYLLKLTVRNIYGDTVEAQRPVHLNMATVITEQISNKENAIASVYPNPLGNSFNIQLHKSGEALSEIFDASGRCVFSTKLNSMQTMLNCSSLAEGVYCIRVTQGNAVSTKVIVKTKD